MWFQETPMYFLYVLRNDHAEIGEWSMYLSMW